MTRLLRFSESAANERPARSAPPLRVIVFQVAGQAYAVALDEVQEIVPLPLLVRPPGLPSVLDGFLNLGGSAVSVVRLDRLFGLPEQVAGLYTPLLVLANPDYRVALLVDRVSEIGWIAADNVVPVREGQALNDCAVGVALLNERIVLLLSAERLLLEKEQQCLAELQAFEQKRLDALEEAGP